MQSLRERRNILTNPPVKTQTNLLGFFMSCSSQGISSSGTGGFNLSPTPGTRVRTISPAPPFKSANRCYRVGVFYFLKTRKGINTGWLKSGNGQARAKKEGITEAIKAAYNHSALTSISRIRLYPERIKDISIVNTIK